MIGVNKGSKYLLDRTPDSQTLECMQRPLLHCQNYFLKKGIRISCKREQRKNKSPTTHPISASKAAVIHQLVVQGALLLGCASADPLCYNWYYKRPIEGIIKGIIKLVLYGPKCSTKQSVYR